jgi:SulP family sulfate permease
MSDVAITPPAGSRRDLVSDFTAGLTTGVADIPDAMASAMLAGGNPVQGLYAIMIATPLGALCGSSAFMTVATTSAVAITAGSALASFSGEQHAGGLAALALLAGVIMAVAGWLKAGRLLRFVSNSVVIGFLTGVSLLVVLSQLGDLTGYSSAYANKVAKTLDLLRHLGQIDPYTTAIGLLTILVIVAAGKTRLSNFAMLIGMLAGSAALIVTGWASVQQVGDVAIIPTSLPLPKLPDPSLWPILIVDALAIAVIAMVQGAGVSKAYPNPDGEYSEPSRDFIGQGAANIGAGLLQGMPVGGSVSTTALNVSSGARSRWANVFSGLVVVAAVLLFSRAVSLVAMPAMAALLIVAGIQSFKWEEIADVWHTGWASRAVMLVTLGLTLLIPLQWAVFAGIALSILLYVASSSSEARVVEYVANADESHGHDPPGLRQPVFCRRSARGSGAALAQRGRPASGHFAPAVSGHDQQYIHQRAGALCSAVAVAERTADPGRSFRAGKGATRPHANDPDRTGRGQRLSGDDDARRGIAAGAAGGERLAGRGRRGRCVSTSRTRGAWKMINQAGGP